MNYLIKLDKEWKKQRSNKRNMRNIYQNYSLIKENNQNNDFQDIRKDIKNLKSFNKRKWQNGYKKLVVFKKELRNLNQKRVKNKKV